MSLGSFLHTNGYLSSVICLHTICSIWLIDRTLSGAIIPGQSWPWSNGNEEVFHIPQSSKAGASPSNGLVSYSGHLFCGGGSYSSEEMQLVYSTTPADLADPAAKWLCDLQHSTLTLTCIGQAVREAWFNQLADHVNPLSDSPNHILQIALVANTQPFYLKHAWKW